MDSLFAFLMSVGAKLAANLIWRYVSKWLDEHRK